MAATKVLCRLSELVDNAFAHFMPGSGAEEINTVVVFDLADYFRYPVAAPVIWHTPTGIRFNLALVSTLSRPCQCPIFCAPV